MPPEECHQVQMNFDREGTKDGSEYGSPVHVGKSSMKCFREAFFRTLRSRMLESNTLRDEREKAEDKLCLLPRPA